MLADHFQHLGGQAAGDAHFLDVFGRLDGDGHWDFLGRTAKAIAYHFHGRQALWGWRLEAGGWRLEAGGWRLERGVPALVGASLLANGTRAYAVREQARSCEKRRAAVRRPASSF
ncbi:hypothetical protein CW310_06115 [Pseudomonas citronellolis]|nr:hypothetical protein CW310_06115 [Pseudomonas citronellolis]